jgi:hypothetical protein
MSIVLAKIAIKIKNIAISYSGGRLAGAAKGAGRRGGHLDAEKRSQAVALRAHVLY